MAYRSFAHIRDDGLRLWAHCNNLRCPRPICFAEIALDALIAAGKDGPPDRYRFVCSVCGQPGVTQVSPRDTGGLANKPDP